jgi:hypothetical protein
LIAQLSVSSGNRGAELYGDCKELDGALIYVQPLKTEHARVSTISDRRLRCVAVAVAVAVNAHDNDNHNAHDNDVAVSERP